MTFLKNFLFQKTQSPFTLDNGISKSPTPLINESNKLKEENEMLKKENEKLKEEKSKYLQLLMITDQEYKKKLSNIQNYVNELETKVKHYQSIPKFDISHLNETIKTLTNENEKLKNELQKKCRLMEVNLDREYKSIIWTELQKTPGIFYNQSSYNSRKTEMYFINKEIIPLQEVIIPKVIFEDNNFKIERRKLTDEEIDELNEGKTITCFNDGSRFTSLSAFDVEIKLVNESEITTREKFMEKFAVKKDVKTKGKKIVKNKGTTQSQAIQSKSEIKIEKKEPIVEKQTITISLKDAYFGKEIQLNIFNKSQKITIPPGIKDGEIITLTIGKNENNQDLRGEITFKYDTSEYSCFYRDGNNLIGYFEYDKKYYNQLIYIPFFDDKLNATIKLDNCTATLNKYGFLGNDGNRGDYIIIIKLT